MKQVIVLVLVCMLVVVVSGCTAPAPQNQAPQINNQNDAQKTVGEVSQDVSNLSDALNDLDAQLG